MALPRRAWVRHDRLRISVGHFRSCLHKQGIAPSVACECGTEEQAIDHVVLHCTIHRPPHVVHGLTVLDDDTIKWLLNTRSQLALQSAKQNKALSKAHFRGF